VKHVAVGSTTKILPVVVFARYMYCFFNKSIVHETNIETSQGFSVRTQYSKHAQEATHSAVQPTLFAHMTFCLHHWSVKKAPQQV
jgi:hypothetical protein